MPEIQTRLVSIVMPVYNAEHFLSQAIKSVLAQDYTDWELIVVDDGSSDDSLKAAQNFENKDSRIKVFQQQNLGPAAARNTGVRQAQGEFIFFLDADDYISEHTLSVMVEAYDKHQPDMVMSNFRKKEGDNLPIPQKVFFDLSGKEFAGEIKELSGQEIADYVRHFLKNPSNHLVSYCWARLYKASHIKKYNLTAREDLEMFEDYVFNLKYLSTAQKVIFINQPLYTYVTRNREHVSASMKVLDADSLTHDMKIFEKSSREYFKEAKQTDIDLIGHAIIHYAIVFLVRTCGQVTADNKQEVKREIKKLINSPIIRQSLSGYEPAGNNSKLLPRLMRWRLAGCIMKLGVYKARRRYGKIKIK